MIRQISHVVVIKMWAINRGKNTHCCIADELKHPLLFTEEHGGRLPISVESHIPRIIETLSYEHLNRITSKAKLQQSGRDLGCCQLIWRHNLLKNPIQKKWIAFPFYYQLWRKVLCLVSLLLLPWAQTADKRRKGRQYYFLHIHKNCRKVLWPPKREYVHGCGCFADGEM